LECAHNHRVRLVWFRLLSAVGSSRSNGLQQPFGCSTSHWSPSPAFLLSAFPIALICSYYNCLLQAAAGLMHCYRWLLALQLIAAGISHKVPAEHGEHV